MLSILVIDDDPDTLTLLKVLLNYAGFTVFTANGAKEALEALSLTGEIDLILMDVQMEEMTGPDLLLMLEEKHPAVIASVPVVFLTGMNKVPESRAIGYIRKGTGALELLAAIHGFIESGQHPQYKQCI